MNIIKKITLNTFNHDTCTFFLIVRKSDFLVRRESNFHTIPRAVFLLKQDF